MELRKSKFRHPINLVLTIFLFSQFRPATAQTLTVNTHYRSSTKSPAVNSPTTAYSRNSQPLLTSQFPVRINFTRRRWPRPRRTNRAKAEFLNAHNAVRQRLGEPLFQWNGKLAAYARAWANKRVNDCRFLHSHGPFGENIFWGGRNHWRPRDVVRIWADEYKYYNEKANTCEPQHMCGHYTQIVWRESTKVGCARQDCSNGGVYVICVYNPPGNFEGENPFGRYNDQSGVLRSDPPAAVVRPVG